VDLAGNPMSVTYNSQESFTISAPVMATNIRPQFINQVPGATYNVRVDTGPLHPTTADANGTVEALFNKVNAGTHTFACVDCVAATDAGTGTTSLVTSVSTAASTLRNDVTQQVGTRITTGSTAITVHQLGRYYVSGTSGAHPQTPRLVDAHPRYGHGQRGGRHPGWSRIQVRQPRQGRRPPAEHDVLPVQPRTKGGATCHTTATWLNAVFNHTYFPVNHGGANGVCATCHTNPNDYSVFQCTNCHAKANTDNNHRGVGGYVYNSVNCYNCHRNGRN